MAQTIKHKRSKVAGKVPTLAQVELGELSLNVNDGKLFIERDRAGVQAIISTQLGLGMVDVNTSAANPVHPTTKRSQNGDDCKSGDLHYNTTARVWWSFSEAPIYANSVWHKVGGAFDYQQGAGLPNVLGIATNSTGGPLVEGDMYWDTVNNAPWFWDAANNLWVKGGGGGLVIADNPPANPQDGDLWYDSGVNGRTYAWSVAATAWIDISPDAAAGGAITISDTAPTNPVDGDMWYDSGANGRAYAWSIVSQAWLDISPGLPAVVANGSITSVHIADGGIATADLANGAVTTVKIADDAITGAKIADNAVTLGTHTTGNYVESVTAGTGITVTNTAGAEGAVLTVAHADTSTLNGVQTVANQFIRSITVDANGHVTATTSAVAGGGASNGAAVATAPGALNVVELDATRFINVATITLADVVAGSTIVAVATAKYTQTQDRSMEARLSINGVAVTTWSIAGSLNWSISGHAAGVAGNNTITVDVRNTTNSNGNVNVTACRLAAWEVS